MYESKLKRIRKEADLSQAQIAELIGVSLSTYCKYEIGARNPSRKFLKRICDLTNTSFNEFALDEISLSTKKDKEKFIEYLINNNIVDIENIKLNIDTEANSVNDITIKNTDNNEGNYNKKITKKSNYVLNNKALAEILISLRNCKNLSQKELADLTNISVYYISLLENGNETVEINNDTIDKLAQFYGISKNTFFLFSDVISVKSIDDIKAIFLFLFEKNLISLDTVYNSFSINTELKDSILKVLKRADSVKKR